MRVPLVLAALFVAGSARAEPPSTDDAAYERHMALGIRLYDDRSFDAAQIEFERAYAIRKGAGPLINIALCEKGRSQYVKAARVLSRALAEHRSQTNQVAQMEEALAELRQLIGKVSIELTPQKEPVIVTLDGERQTLEGTANTFEVGPGVHALRVTAEGYLPFTTRLELGAGDSLTVVVPLVPDSGTLDIEVRGRRASVQVDGALEKSGPVHRRLSAGTHLVAIERDRARYTTTIAVAPGGRARIMLDAAGLLHVGDAGPRGPDPLEAPPQQGVYVLAGLSFGGRIGQSNLQSQDDWSDVLPFGGPDLHLGYSLNRYVGLEAYAVELFSANSFAPESVTQVGGAIRLSTGQDRVHFAARLGLGFAVEVPELGRTGFAAFHLVGEPLVAGRAGRVLWGFGTPVTFMTGAYAPNVALSTRLELGYGTW